MLYVYGLLILLALPSILLIRESQRLGKIMEYFLGMEPGSFYSKNRKHAKLVGVMKWPLLFALIGIVVPTPWSFDFLLTFITGFVVGWKDFWRREPQNLPATDILVMRKPEEV